MAAANETLLGVIGARVFDELRELLSRTDRQRPIAVNLVIVRVLGQVHECNI